MRVKLLVAGVVLLSCISAFPADQGSKPKFQSESNLVLVPTIVHDKSGAHIPNLQKKDFTLSADGHERPISVFEEVRPGSQIMQRANVAPGEFTNMFMGRAQPNRLTLIALDTVLTQEFRQFKAREDLLKLLAKTIQNDSMVGLVLITTTGTRVVHDFTTDPKILLEALNKIIGSQPIARSTETMTEQTDYWDFMGERKVGTNIIPHADATAALKSGQIQLSRFYQGEFERKAAELERRVAIDKEITAMEQISQALRGIPGRKSLIWVGSGFPLTNSSAALGEYVPDSESLVSSVRIENPITRPDPMSAFRTMLPSYEHVWKSLNDANVAVYGIDVRGLTTTNESAAVRLWSPNERQRQHYFDLSTMETFQVFADVTGGRAYSNTNDFQDAYRESLQDGSAYYLLGYYLDRKKDKPGWHDLSVKLNRPADVRARRGFYLRTNEDKETREREMELALLSPLDYTGLPMMGRWTSDSGKGDKHKVGFTVLLPPGLGLIDDHDNNHIDVEFYVRAQDAQGKTVAHSGQEMEGHLPAEVVAKALKEGIRYENTLELAPGEYTIHFVVRDKLTDRIGTVITPLRVGESQPETK